VRLKKAPTSLNFLAHPDSKFGRIHEKKEEELKAAAAKCFGFKGTKVSAALFINSIRRPSRPFLCGGKQKH
jgi:hypothetical protein